jgi:integrase
MMPKSIRLYDLRHTCATLLLARNVHPKYVQELLGHASITLTLDTWPRARCPGAVVVKNRLGDLLAYTSGYELLVVVYVSQLI